MSGDELLRVAAVLAILGTCLAVVGALTRRFGASAEIARKSVHMTMGLVCLGFPFVFDRSAPVWLLALLATASLALLRRIPALRRSMGSALHDVARPSYGDILFAPAVATVFHLSGGSAILHVIPVAVLTLADAAGALAGQQWGHWRYRCGSQHKSVQGSLAFIIAALVCVFVPLIAIGHMEPGRALSIALILSILTMLGEGMSERGFDNLILPIGSLFILQRLLPLETPDLIWRLIALALLFALLIWGSRWSTLDGAALLAGVLLVYGCAVLADWRFALPCVGVFICHLFTSHRLRASGSITHRIDSVISHAIACLPWVLVAMHQLLPREQALAGISFAMANQLILLDAGTWCTLRQERPDLLRSMLKGWLVAGLPGLIWIGADLQSLALPMVVALAASYALARIAPWLHHRLPDPSTRLWLLKGALALLCSLPAWWQPS